MPVFAPVGSNGLTVYAAVFLVLVAAWTGRRRREPARRRPRWKSWRSRWEWPRPSCRRRRPRLSSSTRRGRQRRSLRPPQGHGEVS
ncbi:hypothetical protein FNV62_26205 [Streptomyces sp. RLB3-17]|nr:hypothetical protein FNV62_26205 [Streptomyces sp. RLB3-17]